MKTVSFAAKLHRFPVVPHRKRPQRLVATPLAFQNTVLRYPRETKLLTAQHPHSPRTPPFPPIAQSLLVLVNIHESLRTVRARLSMFPLSAILTVSSHCGRSPGFS